MGMGDTDALERGLAASERARPLYEAGKTREAAALYLVGIRHTISVGGGLKIRIVLPVMFVQ